MRTGCTDIDVNDSISEWRSERSKISIRMELADSSQFEIRGVKGRDKTYSSFGDLGDDSLGQVGALFVRIDALGTVTFRQLFLIYSHLHHSDPIVSNLLLSGLLQFFYFFW